jgi:hypothetical protein
MSTLGVAYYEMIEDILSRSWCVEDISAGWSDDGYIQSIILDGFSTKKDAMIAKEFLDSLPVDWTLPSKPMWAMAAKAGYPDRHSLMKAACERLRW